ncbi:MAG: flagellar basal body rod protein FlgG [Clostridium sp.]|jgi:flagellar basal-body rod protein FlgG|uniref:flagellar hook-basal body complex protein n=1 Tax=Clostridium sp. TaxID=1506 RepID=UPI0025B85BCF|nr:flagellar hook-basal body complex protein [Clostridium sp.]MCH3964203.1 flagellar basal body rod protein FlgG [Clostridium sp.]MCI1715384.1 flagellar basal body rod protein FlgG [Clostridium sp.]MCI1799825.1 flagellar basal body rod protein FlgG [Clostridium sp.]MCI1813567.1 flagellar basal body rod protein FlgG [Clostridium sp.]MCI1870643.1 flagellar basal body rod protein FlgG [Clostridium sp.]
MLRAIWNSTSAMNAQQEKLNSISNNLANVNTTGYKSENVNFQDLMYETLDRRGYPVNQNSDTKLISGDGSKTSQWIRNTQEGSLVETGKKTDLAIDGQGFFRVTLANGQAAYERAGDFIVDSAGTLVDQSGNRVNMVLENGARAGELTKDNFLVDKEGYVYIQNGDQDVLYGKINVYNVVGDDSMISIGNNLYSPKPGARIYQNNDVSIQQGFLEQSNVDVGKEMSEMILSQRAFELSAKALSTSDEMWGLINSMKR